MENVRGLAGAEPDGITPMSMCVSVCLAIGMQVRVMALQAAAYGVPQNRVRLCFVLSLCSELFHNRIFVMSAAPGEKLPEAPMPTHSIALNHLESLLIGVAKRKFVVPSPSYVDERTLVEWKEHAPSQCTSGVEYELLSMRDGEDTSDMVPHNTAAVYAPLNVWCVNVKHFPLKVFFLTHIIVWSLTQLFYL